jgi:hypothetical protein
MTSSNKYLQNWQVNCSSARADCGEERSTGFSLEDEVVSLAGATTGAGIPIFLCGFLGFKQCRMNNTPIR